MRLEMNVPTKKRLNSTRQNWPPDSVLVEKTYLCNVSKFLQVQDKNLGRQDGLQQEVLLHRSVYDKVEGCNNQSDRL